MREEDGVLGARVTQPPLRANQAAASLAEPTSARQGAPGTDDVEGWRDEDLTFCLHVYHDLGGAGACLAGLRRVFPAARVVVVSDGDDDPRVAALGLRHAAEVVRGQRLYGVACGGRIVARLLALHLERPTPWLFKIDTDARVHRRFRRLPRGACVFGTLERRTYAHGEPLDPPVVQGGCMGFTLAAVERLQASRVFESPALLDYAATWADTRDARERARNGRVSFDHLVRYGCRETGLEPRAFDEVRSVWRGRVRNPDLRYAVTHPHKPWWQLPRLLASLHLSRLRAAWRPETR